MESGNGENLEVCMDGDGFVESCDNIVGEKWFCQTVNEVRWYVQ